MLRRAIFVLGSFALCVLSGCGGSNPTALLPAPTPASPAQARLYVPAIPSGFSNAVLQRLDSPAGLMGNVAPSATIGGSVNNLMTPLLFALDDPGDRMFVVDSTGGTTVAIRVFDHISTKTGDVPPDRVVTGGATALNLFGPMVVDQTRDILYVIGAVNFDGTSNLLAFNNASTMNGNVAPARTLAITRSGFTIPDMVLDPANNRLFVLNSANEVEIYENIAAAASGPVSPARIISGPNTSLVGAAGITLDPSGRIVVACLHSNIGGVVTPAHITIFDNAATANGNVAPSATITGSSTRLDLFGPKYMVVDKNAPGGGDLYVSVGAGQVMVFSNLATVNGNIAPARVFTVPSLMVSVAPLALGFQH